MSQTRQSLKPPPVVYIGFAVLILFFALVWGAVTLATSHGDGHTCQTADKKQTYNGQTINADSDKCR
jgi:hypothetical protein